MTAVALAGRSESAEWDSRCTDLNLVVARAEYLLELAASGRAAVELRLSPNIQGVLLTVREVEQVLVGLCTGACLFLGHGGRLVIETRGVNDAPLSPALASTPEPGPRLIVRAEPVAEPPIWPEDTQSRALARSNEAFDCVALEALLERVGGRLSFVPLGSGLGFVAHLPCFTGPTSSGRVPVALAAGADVILLVEDEPQVQAVTARILRAFGYAVITAHNERTALAEAERHGTAIRLVVSDLVLPGVSGIELVKRLREPCAGARVLYVSGYSREHIGALASGSSFLRKPFTAEQLIQTVRALLALRD
jgi:two-component system cell cycle sensor histidine kinase/response regulator CckA